MVLRCNLHSPPENGGSLACEVRRLLGKHLQLAAAAMAEEKLELLQSGDGGRTGTDPGGLDDETEAGVGAGNGAWRRSRTT